MASSGTDDDDMNERVWSACEEGDITTVSSLIETIPDINWKKPDEELDDTFLLVSAFKGHEQIVQLLLEHNADIKARNFDDQSVLHRACSSGNVSLVKLLSEKDPTLLSMKDRHGRSVMFSACCSGNLSVVKLLAEKDPTLVSMKDDNDLTCLHVACMFGWWDIIQFLLLTKEVTMYDTDKYGDTPLDFLSDGVGDDDERKRKDKCLQKLKKTNYLKEEDKLNIPDSSPENNDSDEDQTQATAPDYQEWLDTATKEGVVGTKWSNVSIGGASGTGKSSFFDLLLLKDPVPIHNSTPVLNTLDVCTVEERTKDSKPSATSADTADTTDGSASSSDHETTSESGSGDEEGSSDEVCIDEDDIPIEAKEMKQRMIVSDSSTSCTWQIAEKDALQKKIAETVKLLAENPSPEMSNIFSRSTPFIPINPSSSADSQSTQDTDRTSSAAMPLQGEISNVRSQPIAIHIDKLNARKQILDLLPLIKKCSSLGCTHWIHLLDTGGQALFIDIAPALFRFNSVNLVLHKLDEDLDDLARFFYSIEGKVVGRERRRITNAQLLRSLFSSRMGLKRPDLKGLSGVKISGEARFIIIGSHYDKYKEKLEASEKLESLREKNDRFLDDFKEYKQWIIQYQQEKKPQYKKDKRTGKKKKVVKGAKAELIFPVNTLSREESEIEIAETVRKLASNCYIEAQIPVRWYLVQIEINELKSSGKDIVVLDKMINIGSHLQMGKQEVTASLKYFHDLTICMYFHEVLPGIVFLTPNVLFKILTALASVTLSECKACSHVPWEMSEGLTKRGVFTKDIFDFLSVKDCFSDVFTIDDFLKLMEHLLVICPILPNRVSYYIPSVRKIIDNPVKALGEEFFKVEPLCLSWNGVVPVGLFSLLTQYLQGTMNSNFAPNMNAKNYRNRIRLVYIKTRHEVVLFEMPGFIGIVHSAPAGESAFIRQEVLKGVRYIVKFFSMKDEIAKPTERFLCTIGGHCCITSDKASSKAFFLHCSDIIVTPDHSTLVCSLDLKKRITCENHWKIEAESIDTNSANSGNSTAVDQTSLGSSQGTMDETDAHQEKPGKPPSEAVQPLSLIKMMEFLQPKSYEWNTIGRVFGIPYGNRQSLLRNQTLSDQDRLEAVLNEWIESSPNELTWFDFINVLTSNSLNYTAIAKNVQEYIGTSFS